MFFCKVQVAGWQILTPSTLSATLYNSRGIWSSEGTNPGFGLEGFESCRLFLERIREFESEKFRTQILDSDSNPLNPLGFFGNRHYFFDVFSRALPPLTVNLTCSLFCN